MSRSLFRLTVNGAAVEVQASPEDSLLHVLRNKLGLLGPKFGCGLGLCGACVVQVDAAVVPSCDTPMWSVEGRTVTTLEGLARDGELHPVQQALLDEQAAQCGFCIAGITMSAAALLERDPSPDEDTVVAALDRHLCRCGSHGRIVRAVRRAARATS